MQQVMTVKLLTILRCVTTSKNNWLLLWSTLRKSSKKVSENILNLEWDRMLLILKSRVLVIVKRLNKLLSLKLLTLRLQLSTLSGTLLRQEKLYWTCLLDPKNNWIQLHFWIRLSWILMKIPTVHLKNWTFCLKILLSCLKPSAICFFSTVNLVTMIWLLTFLLKILNSPTKCQTKKISNSSTLSFFKKHHLSNPLESWTSLPTDILML